MVDVISFVVLWIIASLIWAIWLDGVYTPIAGVITAGIASGGFKLIFHNK